MVGGGRVGGVEDVSFFLCTLLYLGLAWSADSYRCRFELALGWYGNYDGYDLASLSLLSHGPTVRKISSRETLC